LPAYVVAEGASRPNLGTLVLTPQDNGALAASIQRGTGNSLDDLSTYAETAAPLSTDDRTVLTLAGNLASRSGLNAAPVLTSHRIGFILLGTSQSPGGLAVQERAEDALNGNSLLTQVGTTPLGLLWRYGALPSSGLTDPHPDGGDTRTWILGGLGIVFAITLLLAIPLRGSRRRTSVATVEGERATLGEDDDA
jgi:hypothetical protein